MVVGQPYLIRDTGIGDCYPEAWMLTDLNASVPPVVSFSQYDVLPPIQNKCCDFNSNLN